MSALSCVGLSIRQLTRQHVVFGTIQMSRMSTEVNQLEKTKSERQMSSAMKMYLQKKREHDMFISKERAEFEMGKQHLANMMGLDPHNLTQEQIDQSIEYLFPSGLAAEARPVMKPPEEVFPKQKDAEFDMEGRPYQTFFFTLKPNFYEAMYKLRDQMEAVTIFGDRMTKQGKRPDPEQILNAGKLADSRWATSDEVAKICLERVTPEDHKEMVALLDRLVSHPFSYRVRDDIFKWRVTEGTLATQQQFITPVFDDEGRAVVEFQGGQRKTAVANVKVIKPGTGKFMIRHKDEPKILSDITYFYALRDRHQILFPLQFTKMLNLVDVECEVQGGGPSGQSGAIRYAMAMCLRSFVDRDMIDDMKLVGLLTADVRVKERKMYGRVKARKAYTWKRR